MNLRTYCTLLPIAFEKACLSSVAGIRKVCCLPDPVARVSRNERNEPDLSSITRLNVESLPKICENVPAADFLLTVTIIGCSARRPVISVNAETRNSNVRPPLTL